MTSKKSKVIIIVFVVIVALLSLRVIFDSKFDDFTRFIQTRDSYEGGTDKFDEDFQGLIDWEEQYKKDHPDATKADIDKAFKEAWGK